MQILATRSRPSLSETTMAASSFPLRESDQSSRRRPWLINRCNTDKMPFFGYESVGFHEVSREFMSKIGNESVPLQLAQRWFPGLDSSSAKI